MELARVIGAREGARAEGMGVGHGQLIGQRAAIRKSDFHAPAEGFLARVGPET